IRSVKGIAGPVRAWAVLQASSVASRFEALHPTGLTALVGREEEFELLRRRWLKATEGESQGGRLRGEPGIGKSRLTSAFVGLLAGEPHIRLRYSCSPQHTDSALYPDHRPNGTCRRTGARRQLASETRQARSCAQAGPDICAGCRALCRDAVAAERWTLSRGRAHPAAAPAKNAGSTCLANRSPGPLHSGADGLRGCALVRPH